MCCMGDKISFGCWFLMRKYVENSCLSGEKGNVGKVDPLLCEGGVPAYYWKLGGQVANAFEVGKKYKPKQNK